jgi:cobalt/nickel transport system permease protein
MDENPRFCRPDGVDPRAKWFVTFAFLLVLTSFGRYEISRLTPLALYPICIAAVCCVPLGKLFRKIALALPFVLFVGLFNPLFDREIAYRTSLFAISGGWISFFSITLRALLAVSAAVLLAMTTPFERLCLGLEKMGFPRALVTQLQFLYRYLSLLQEEAVRMIRAHDLRSRGNRPKIRISSAASMIGFLLLRSLDRGTRIYRAMLVRGYDGEVRLMKPLDFAWKRDGMFALFWTMYFLTVRFINVPDRLFGWVFGR